MGLDGDLMTFFLGQHLSTWPPFHTKHSIAPPLSPLLLILRWRTHRLSFISVSQKSYSDRWCSVFMRLHPEQVPNLAAFLWDIAEVIWFDFIYLFSVTELQVLACLLSHSSQTFFLLIHISPWPDKSMSAKILMIATRAGHWRVWNILYRQNKSLGHCTTYQWTTGRSVLRSWSCVNTVMFCFKLKTV